MYNTRAEADAAGRAAAREERTLRIATIAMAVSTISAATSVIALIVSLVR